MPHITNNYNMYGNIYNKSSCCCLSYGHTIRCQLRTFVPMALAQFIRWISPITYPVCNLESGGRPAVLLYHMVSREACPHTQHLFRTVTPKQFERDLDLLGKNHRFCAMEDVVADRFYERPSVHLTFDDGYRQCADTIAPILLRKGIPATFFINTAFVDNTDLMFRCKASYICSAIGAQDRYGSQDYTLAGVESFEHFKKYIFSVSYENRAVLDQTAEWYAVAIDEFLEQYRPYLTSDQVVELVRSGFTIGGHTHQHPMLGELAPEDVKREVTDNIIALKRVTGLAAFPFAFPFHDLNVSLDTIDDIYGIDGITSTFGISGVRSDSHPKHRHRIVLDESPRNVLHQVHAAKLTRRILRLMGKDKVSRR